MKISKGDYENKCRLNVSHIELKCWIQNVIYKNTINTPSLCAPIYSDTCPTGWGATCGNLSTGGNWSIVESQKHINYLEMLAALLAIRLYCKDLQDLTVLFKIDNTFMVSCVNKQSGLDKEILILVKQFWKFSIHRNINVVSSYKEKQGSRQRISEDKR